MANKIQVKRSAVPSKVPTTADLDLGEIAINTYDGIAYIKKDNGTASIVPLGGGSGDVVGPSSAADNALARFDGTTGKLIQNGIVTQDDNGTLGNVNAIALDTTPTSAPTSQGALVWDADYNTLAIQNNTNVHTHAGQQNYFYIKASSAISKGDLCYFTGVVGASGVIQAAPAIAGITNAQYILGIAAESIALNGFGYVQTFGILKGFDTSAWSAGNILYYDSTNGGLTATYPTSGIIVTVAAVINSSAGAGIVAIRPQVTQRITAGTGVSVSQTTSGTSVSNTGVTSVTGTSPINSSGGATPAISLKSGYGDTQNPYASKTANYVLAAPNGSAGAPTFRALVAADLPNTAVTAGSYTNASITVDAQGRITSASSGSGGGVTSFNTRTGAVTLTSGDVTGALGYTPYNSTNPNGYITSSGSISGSAGSVPASGITGQTGMWTSSARPGPYRLYRNDDNSAYNVQTTWSANRSGYWSLRGYNGDTYHAGCWVNWAGEASTAYYLSGTWDSSGRCYSREWIQMDNYSGLYSPLNGAHLYPNDGSYGSWRVLGSRNGWAGMEFPGSGAGNVSLMMNSNESGHHNNSYGWQFRWNNGTMYCHKNSYGGGTSAAVLDSSNWSSYVSALGAGQSWQDVTSSRAGNTTYTNSTGKPILVAIIMGYGDLALYVDGVLTWFFGWSTSARAQMVVPNGSTYRCDFAGGRYFSSWKELR